jgi:hypothetical protein
VRDTLRPTPIGGELELMTYLGMRRVLRARDPAELLELAKQCNARHAETMTLWERGGPFPPLRWLGEEHLKEALAASPRVLVCAAHCGPFFRVVFDLAQRDYLVTLLSDHRTYESESAGIERHVPAYVGSHHRPPEEIVQMIDVVRPTAAWEMIVAIKEGRLGFVYFDADVGMDERSGRTVVPVKLAGVPILARTGPALIAALGAATVVPAIAGFGDGTSDEFRFYAPIVRREAENQDAFVRRATDELYALLETTILTDPTSWDSWHTLVHRVGAPDAPENAPAPEFPDPERVLATSLRFDEEHIEAFDSPYGPLLAHIERGSVLLRTETLDALLESVDGCITLAELIDRLASRFDEATILGAVLSLTSSGFMLAA